MLGIVQLKKYGCQTSFTVRAQLVERLLPTTEIRGSNPVFGKFYLLPTVLKILKKRKRSQKAIKKV